MAALRHGIRTVIIPADNERDLDDIDPTVRRSLNFVTVTEIDAVLETALNPISVESMNPVLTNLPGEVQNKSRKTGLRQ